MELLTVKEASEFLKVSEHTMDIWRSRGGGPPFVRAGRLIRYDREALEQWLLGRTEKGGRKTPIPKEERMLDPVKAAEFVGVHKVTLARWRQAGTGPAYEKPGGRIFYDLKVLEEWKKEQEKEGK